MIALKASHNSITFAGWRRAAIAHRSHPVTSRRIRAERRTFITHNWVFDRS
jgi:hypothetical protein